MKYYLHDTNSFNDDKITMLYIAFGYEGLGLFYTILEKIAQQEKPVNTEVLKHQLKVGKKLDKCWKFMESIDIISSNNGETFNKQLLNFSKKYQVKKEKNKKRISEWRENQENTKNVTRYESVCNTHKVNESKVNESKVKNFLLSEIEISDVSENNKPYFEIAKAFQTIIKKNSSDLGISTKHIDSTKESDIKHIRLLIEIDKNTIEDCRAVWNFLKDEIPKNDFSWKKNILSLKKVREKFNHLKIAANERNRTNLQPATSKHRGATTDDIYNIIKAQYPESFTN